MARLQKNNISRTLLRTLVLSGLTFIWFSAGYTAEAATFLDYRTDIVENTTWAKEGSPYVVLGTPAGAVGQAWTRVHDGATLTIEPGVVVKFEQASSLTIWGNLQAVGTEAEPIYFTSVKNDAIGGDTNGDGTATTPSALDYWGVDLNGADGVQNFEQVKISYMGSNFSFQDTEANFHSVDIRDSFSSLFISQTDFSIADLSLENVRLGLTIQISKGNIDNMRAESGCCSQASALFIGSGSTTTISNLVIKDFTLINPHVQSPAAITISDSKVTMTDSVLDTGNVGGISIYGNYNILGTHTDAQFDNVTITNFQGSGIKVFGGDVDVTNSVLDNNIIGVHLITDVIQTTTDFTISSSSIANNSQSGILNQSNFVAEAINNWWGDVTGPYQQPHNLGGLGNDVGNQFTNVVNFIPWLGANPKGKRIDPVVIVPGIMGSAYKNGEWLIDPIFHVYDNLVDTLEANGYVKNENLFTFGYDWRNSNVLTAILLRLKIDDVKEICQCSKVDVVAHSMGGLVAREYIQSDKYQYDVDQLIFLGTPHKGAPKDYLAWEGGDIFNTGLDSFIVETRYLIEAKRLGYKNLFEYVHGWPITSIKELLPDYSYLKSATSGELLLYPNDYPVNDFLINLNSNIDKLFSADIGIVNIVGNTGLNTISIIRVIDSDKLPMWQHGYPEGYDEVVGDRGLEFDAGDGTVPEYSGSIGDDYDLEIISEHVSLPTEAEEEIFSEINGGTLSTVYKRSLFSRMLIGKIYSPADFVIIAPDGRRVGKDFITGLEVNEIQGAFYSGFDTNDEYVTIPDPLDGEYKIELKGTNGGGSYSFDTIYLSKNVPQVVETLGITAPNQITKINIDVSSGNSEPISAERNVTQEVLINDIKGAYELGWIDSEGIRDSLLAKIKEDKIQAKAFLNELNAQEDKHINAQAFHLLLKDLNYIISHK